ncbi:MAG TPA: SpoIIE family protein phosphatase [Anaerolineales bacterium]|nr:SpoIIE family protein phosphatase [Anaerolineales bacterium]
MFARLRKTLRSEKEEAVNLTEEEMPVPAYQPEAARTFTWDLTPNDPLYAYLLSASSVVEVDRLALDSPSLRALKAAGVKVCVPLVTQGELVGVLNLGDRMSEQEYSSDDRRLLNNLATQAAPALRVAQLARQQQAEARQRERLEQEMRVARIIQQTLLPKSLPNLPGWQVAAHWQPARAVGGDFYDFIDFPDGRLGMVTGDVTDKGVPAALVMATTRSILRSASERSSTPGQILAYANELLVSDIPPNMFVTCLYMILDPASRRLTIANAGHNLPIHRRDEVVHDLRVTGMPLGLMPGMDYEEIEVTLEHGDNILVYSDGLVEAHNPAKEMFGFPRLRELLACSTDGEGCPAGEAMIPFLIDDLSEFTGPDWEQEDDLTFLILECLHSPVAPIADTLFLEEQEGVEYRLLAEFSLPSEPGNEIPLMERVVQSFQGLGLPGTVLERLKTAVAETAMNAIEHGNRYQAELPVEVRVSMSADKLCISIRDQGGSQPIPEPETPDIEAKLAGLQSPRGWGLFLIKNMVDEMRVSADGVHHTVELVFRLKGA